MPVLSQPLRRAPSGRRAKTWTRRVLAAVPGLLPVSVARHVLCAVVIDSHDDLNDTKKGKKKS